MSLIDFLLDWCFFIVAVLLIFSRPTLVWTVLVQAVADPLPDVDEVLVGRVHHLVHKLSPLHKVGEHPIQVHFGGTALDVLCVICLQNKKIKLSATFFINSTLLFSFCRSHLLCLKADPGSFL